MSDFTELNKKQQKTLVDSIPLANARLDNIMQAAAGSLPKDADERNFALYALEHAFGVDLDDALGEYAKYQNDNFVTKRMKDLAMKAAITIHKGTYQQQVSNRINAAMSERNIADVGSSNYNAKLFTGLQRILSQPSLASQLTDKIMDYRDLSKPLPFVESNINYSGVVNK